MTIHNESIDRAWRKELIAGAHGKVLEVNVGTGSNFRYYPPDASVTATDLSHRMIEIAKQEAGKAGITANFLVGGVENLAIPAQSFDTILSTLSLCAYRDPSFVLRLFNAWCKPSGTILLMEHGLSDWRVVQWVQQALEPVYYNRSGCHLDRDIHSLIKNSPLKIERIERRMMGMMMLVHARPSRIFSCL